MYAGGSLFLIAIGAILYWAVTYQVNGVSLHMVGLILMAIGVIGLLWGLLASATRRHRLP
jgi:cytochrome b